MSLESHWWTEVKSFRAHVRNARELRLAAFSYSTQGHLRPGCGPGQSTFVRHIIKAAMGEKKGRRQKGKDPQALAIKTKTTPWR
ncbi:uncharacterized protein Dyak_GE28115, isoform C [Drosophila yakuba]|uniref:Uncharacterized protein, isoform C n=1 Tax=Drosophila yakuba TaxID=7245 RepID=A0A0R1E4J7_DROYA|nr:uncharacterized protein Dyak_GE28115, isoform C [Drosophila yakuba]